MPTIALALGLSAFTPALAQQPAAASSRDESVEAAKLAYSRQIAEVKYDSLPLEEIVAGLRKDFWEINFILPEELGQIIVRLELRNVTLPEILQAIQIAGRAEHLVSEQTNERLITFRRDDAAAQRETPKPALRTFNISGYPWRSPVACGGFNRPSELSRSKRAWSPNRPQPRPLNSSPARTSALFRTRNCSLASPTGPWR